MVVEYGHVVEELVVRGTKKRKRKAVRVKVEIDEEEERQKWVEEEEERAFAKMLDEIMDRGGGGEGGGEMAS